MTVQCQEVDETRRRDLNQIVTWPVYFMHRARMKILRGSSYARPVARWTRIADGDALDGSRLALRRREYSRRRRRG